MATRSLVSRSESAFEFNPQFTDRYFLEWNSLASPKALNAEGFFVSLNGAFDAQGLFLNDLHIYLNVIDDSLLPHTQDITEAFSRHYSSFLISGVGKDKFTKLVLSRLKVLAKYHDPSLSTPAAVEARAKQLAEAVFDRIPQNTQPVSKLGEGNSINDLDHYHWLHFVHSLVPAPSLNLGKVVTNTDLRTLGQPVGLTFSSGPIDMPRSDRNNVGSTATRGSFSFDFSIVFKNPVSDDIDQVNQEIAEIKDAITAIDGKIQSLAGQLDELTNYMAQVDDYLRTGLKNYNDVKGRVTNIETNSLQMVTTIRNNTSTLEDIRRRVSSL